MFKKAISEDNIKLKSTYVYTKDSSLSLPRIEPEDLKMLISEKKGQIVVYLYYYYAGQVYHQHENPDPILAGDEKMKEFMKALGEDAKYYMINMQKYRHTDLAEFLGIENGKQEEAYPKIWYQLNNSSRQR
jgi:hypothetical protein